MKTEEYVIYLRKSEKDKKKQVQSLWDQLRACLDYAQSNNLKIKKRPLDYDVFESQKDLDYESSLSDKWDKKLFKDNRGLFIIRESFSGKDSWERKKWTALTEYLLVCEWKVWLISYSPDRQSRNLVEAWQLIELVEQTWMELRYPTFHFENTTSWKMMLWIWFVLSKQYVDNLRDTSWRGTKSAFNKGTALWYAKHWYQINENKYHEPSKYFNIIREAFELKIYKWKTDEQIKRFLDAKWYKYKYGKDMIGISNNSVGTMFSDSFYYWLFTHWEEQIDLNESNPNFKPVISIEEYNRLTAIKQWNKSQRSFWSRKKELEALYPTSKWFIITEDNYIATIYLPSPERFEKRLEKARSINPKTQLKDIVEPHQMKIKVWSKKSTMFWYSSNYKYFEKYILKMLKDLKMTDEQYDEYLEYIKFGFNNKQQENNSIRQTLQIQRNNINKDLSTFLTKCLWQDRTSIEEEAYQQEVIRLEKLIESLDNDIDELRENDRDIILEFKVLWNFINNAEQYYVKATYVQKRKINEILFSNIKISPRGVCVVPRQWLEDIFNLKWQAHLESNQEHGICYFRI